MRLCLSPWLILASVAAGLHAAEQPPAANLLLNPALRFHSFANSRTGNRESFSAGAVACWNEDAYGDVMVCRAPKAGFRPALPAENVVTIRPGKRFYQFSLLGEMGLDHGDRVSFAIAGRQSDPDSLQASIHLMRLDSQSGQWTPADDKRTFPKHSRGELVKGPSYAATSGKDPDFRLAIENAAIVGEFTESPDKSTDQPNTIGIEIELVNLSKEHDVSVYAPCLCRGPRAVGGGPESRALPTYYRGIPRTIQKLWRGEPLHIIVMGSSIDRGSANPRMYLYDEDPKSLTYKQPRGGGDFDGQQIGHPEWNDYIGWWQHYFMYGGRLRRALMEKFDYPIDKILLNTMACDGSSISESHSGLADYASLGIAPGPNENGHGSGKSWQELYPAVFARPEGPRPDLVIFGSGANEKVDGGDEIAIFEGAIRWFQRHYPNVEFLFCMWNNRESYTPNTGHLMELALRYQIPYIDFARDCHLACRHCNGFALCPRDGHPQAAGHYLWAKYLERAFDAGDPIEPGIAQSQLPERLHPATIGWEGEMRTYAAGDPRIHAGTLFVLDDMAVNLWATCKHDLVGIRIDGVEHTGSRRKPSARRDVRNSSFAAGLLSLGDRHIVEVSGNEARLVAVDSKIVPDRQWIGVESPRWHFGQLRPEPFASQVGAPYGSRKAQVSSGSAAEIALPGTDFSIAYVDQAGGGSLVVELDGRESLRHPTDVAYTTTAGEKLFLENRRAVRGLPYGMHVIRAKAVDGPVTLLGIMSYDMRSNRANERVLRGTAYPGETVSFTLPFRARPLVLCTGGLTAAVSDVTCSEVKLAGTGPGAYEIVGE